MKLLWLCCLLLSVPAIACGNCPRVGGASREGPGNPNELLASIKAKYAACRSYRDSGMVTSELHAATQTTDQSLTFDTVFLRDYGFRLRMWRGGKPYFYLLSRGGKVVAKTEPNAADEEPSLTAASVAMQGTTLRVSRIVPSLLLGEFKCSAAASMQEDASCASCSVIRLAPSCSSHRTLLIAADAQRAAVVRFIESTTIEAEKGASLRGYDVITLAPVFDADEKWIREAIDGQPWE